MEAEASQTSVREVAGDRVFTLPEDKKKPTPDVLELKKRIQQLQTEAVEQLEQKLQQLVEEALRVAEAPATPPSPSHHLLYDDVKYRNRRHHPSSGGLPEKQFLARESLLTILMRVKHLHTVYNMFVAVLLMLFLHTAVYDLVADGQLKLGFSTIFWNFGGLHIVMATWASMQLAVFALFIAFCHWASFRVSLPISGFQRQLLDNSALIVLIAFKVGFLVLPVHVIQYNQLPPISAMILLCEQMRMIMKSYAFLRSQVPKVKMFKPHTDATDVLLPDFNHFVYFMFAPALVYRDSYPRTKEIRWKVALWHLTEVFGVIFFISFLFERSLVPMFRNFGKQQLSPKAMVVAIFGSMVPSLTVMLSVFYCILHAWMNAFAEITRFADRMFYKDWWNVNSYGAYYRKWNVVVHDWLYTYVYKDLSELLGGKRRTLAILAVFSLSAIVHEYILTFMFGFCYPMLFMAFEVFSVGLMFVSRDRLPGSNLLMWLFFTIGTGLLISLYMMEWFARRHCPRFIDSTWDFFVPRSWFCSPLTSE
ncbi:sterol O-acyltransferase 2-like [Schistocerca serialis cubense]|uniref:sterol O-acyltransferase 2-like n=1 Tax=Schistocerca serialis cubense TaxID=2023355 RepID=UPI00214F48E5|nr:sterol O-acyltransferase 2-like [Schistocerca serialis cubense]